MTTDCLLIGHNDGNFADYVGMVKSWGTETGFWRRLNLSFVEIDGVPHHSMDLLNRSNGRDGQQRPRLSNMDFLCPAVTYLGSYLVRRGFTFDFVNQFQEEKSQLAAKLRREDVRAVAISTTLAVAPWSVEEVVGFVRRHNRSATIIVGGPYIRNQAAALPPPALAEFFRLLGADVYVISHEGELALTRVLDALRHQRPLAGIDNIAYAADGTFVRAGTVVESNPLAENPVDYALFPPERIGELVSTRTAKSCPFACSFCSYPQQGGPYVYEDVAVVEAELDRLRRVGTVTTLTFVDDTFNVPKPRFKELLRMMIRNDYGFRWNSFIRADHVDAEAVELMRQSGCEGVFLGMESGSDTVLATMNKAARSKHYRRLIPQLKEAGILTHCSLIIGFPSETRETVEETVAVIEETQPDTFRAQVWFCDPATPIWKRREEHGLRGTGFGWAHRTMDATTAMDVVEELFLKVRGSLWLPQHGFEWWSVFYLQRKGMPLPQLQGFLRAFNEAIRCKLRDRNDRSLDPGTVDALMASGRF
jgi:anaerobic magnesium-protoporphyrin IX monomethyl ester cyclase